MLFFFFKTSVCKKNIFLNLLTYKLSSFKSHLIKKFYSFYNQPTNKRNSLSLKKKKSDTVINMHRETIEMMRITLILSLEPEIYMVKL